MSPAFIAALGALLLVSNSAAAEAPTARKLRHDPFDWSALQQAADKKIPGAAPAAADAPATASEAAVPAPQLRAVMQGPSGARVNLEGAILAVGESADGYRLLEVREYSAVFSRGKEKIEIELGRRPLQ